MKQDRFRFRCWNKHSKKMIYENFIIVPAIDKDDIENEKEKIMQCTGLKDKNGKLIYEGDIVKFKEFHHNWLIGKILFYQEDCLFVNEFINLNNKKDWDYVSKYCLEVIGNIYENPELLKVEEEE